MSDLSELPAANPAVPPPRRVCLLLALIFVFLMFSLGSQPFAAGLFSAPWDKLAHFLAFGLLAALLMAGISHRPLRVIALVAVVGALDEWHQGTLPGRSADLSDLLTDLAAAIIVVALFRFRRSSPVSQ